MAMIFKLHGFSLLAEGLVRRASDEHIDGFVDKPQCEQMFEWGEINPQLVKRVETQGNQLEGGRNVYLNDHAFKLQADYFAIFGKNHDQRHAARLQLDATF